MSLLVAGRFCKSRRPRRVKDRLISILTFLMVLVIFSKSKSLVMVGSDGGKLVGSDVGSLGMVGEKVGRRDGRGVEGLFVGRGDGSGVGERVMPESGSGVGRRVGWGIKG